MIHNDMNDKQLAALTTRIVSPLLEFPHKLKVDAMTDQSGPWFVSILPAPQDTPKVIGTQGRMFKALRSILIYCAPCAHSFNLIVEEPSVKIPPSHRPFKTDPNWKESGTISVLREIMSAAGEEEADVQSRLLGSTVVFSIHNCRATEEVQDAIKHLITAHGMVVGRRFIVTFPIL